MKKAIYLLLMAGALFSSCKKDQKNGTVIPQKTYKVNFNISDFTQQITGSTKKNLYVNNLKGNSTINVKNYLSQIYYVVTAKSDVTRALHTLKQDSTASNFGTISDDLPAGDYTVMIAAGKMGLSLAGNYNGDIGPHWDINYLPSESPWKDTFFKKFNLTVSGPINQNVTLDRIVAQLEVNILDAIPTNARSLVIIVDNENFTYVVYPSVIYRLLDRLTNKTSIPAAIIGKSNYKKDIIINNTGTTFTVTIICYDAANLPIGTAIVKNVSCEKNRKTILSGSLFGTDNAFNISLSPWDPNPINIPF